MGAALGSIGVIYVGEIPLPQARELVQQGWQVFGQPLPPPDPERELDPAEEQQQLPNDVDTSEPEPYPAGGQPNPLVPNPSTSGEGPPDVPQFGAGPPVLFDPGPPPPYEGGPEERAPPDFDVPLPSEAPAVQPPVTVPPPLEGEMVGPDIVYHDYEGYDQLPGGYYGGGPKRIIEGELDQPPPGTLEQPPWWFGPVSRRVGRVVLGPLGGMVGPIIEAGLPEVLGSGSLPFPPVPTIDVPLPEPDLQWPQIAGPTPEEPQLAPLPPAPEVITVTPSGALPSTSMPGPAPVATRAILPSIWPFLGALAPILRPRHRRRGEPQGQLAQNAITSPEVNPFQPLPISHPVEVLPRGETPPATVEGSLTGPIEGPVPFTQPSPLGFAPNFVRTQEDQDDRCRCRKNEKHEPDPSDTVADVHVYKRRMSNWSLRNLNRGTKAAKLLEKFI